jgi:hypothetical protein
MRTVGMEKYSNHLGLSIQSPARGMTHFKIEERIPDRFTNRLDIFTSIKSDFPAGYALAPVFVNGIPSASGIPLVNTPPVNFTVSGAFAAEKMGASLRPCVTASPNVRLLPSKPTGNDHR